MRSLLCEFTRELGVSYSGIIRAKAQIGICGGCDEELYTGICKKQF